MAATRTKCWDKKCMGVPMAVNDGPARLAERMGRIHYVCDTCGTRWSVTPEWMTAQLDKGIRKPRVRRMV